MPGGRGGGGGAPGAGTLVTGVGIGLGADTGLGGAAGAEPTPYDSSGGGALGGGGFGADGGGASDGAMNCFWHNGQLSTCPALSSGIETRRVQCGQNRSMGAIFPYPGAAVFVAVITA